jgi:hypothetical protein
MLHSLRFLILPLCLCTIAGLPLSPFVVLVSPQAVESEFPCEENEEPSEEEVVAGSSARRRVTTVGKTRLFQATDVACAPREISSFALPAIVGHQLSNGLRAPLLI